MKMYKSILDLDEILPMRYKVSRKTDNLNKREKNKETFKS